MKDNKTFAKSLIAKRVVHKTKGVGVVQFIGFHNKDYTIVWLSVKWQTGGACLAPIQELDIHDNQLQLF